MWRVALVFVVVAGAARAQPPGMTLPEHRAANDAGARLAAAAAAGDVRAVRALLDAKIANGGVWFDDPACRAQFAAPAMLEGARVDAFAACLAKLPLAVSPRVDGLSDTAVLVYRPGIELEARFSAEDQLKTLRWIGYVARREAGDVLPTIAPDALEAARASGSRVPVLDAAARALLDHELSGRAYVHAWLKVCLDASGAVTGVHGRDASSPATEHVLTAAIRDWSFKPILLAGHATPVCSVIRLAYPPDQAPAEEMLPLPPSPPATAPRDIPPTALEALRVKGNKQITPDDDGKIALTNAGISKLVASFKLCIDETGKVAAVTMLKPSRLRSYNDKLAREIARWEYKPYVIDGKPTPVCTAVTFIYSQD